MLASPATSGGEYGALLARHARSAEYRYPWIYVGRAQGVQGWKFHLSTIPTQASRLLECVAPYLISRGVPFKAIADPGLLEALNEGEFGATQVGKAITVYPRNIDETRELALRLRERTAGFVGPRVTTDLRLGDVVYARYGGINPIVERNALGNVELHIIAPNGQLVRDDHRLTWEEPVYRQLADLVVEPPQRRPAHRIDDRYLVVADILERPKGRIVLALDVARQSSVELLLLKQGRAHVFSDPRGRDMRDRLRHQHVALTELGHIPGIPAVRRYFEWRDDGYLVMDAVDGMTIEAYAHAILGRRSWSELSRDERLRILAIFRAVVQLVVSMHASGWVHRDLSASNVLVDRDTHEVWLLDFELSHRIDAAEEPFGRGTVGFMSPQQARGDGASTADDMYSLGCLLILLLTGSDPGRILFSGSGFSSLVAEHANGLEPALLAMLRQCVADDACERPGASSLLRDVDACIASVRAGSAVRHAGRQRPNLLATLRSGILGLHYASVSPKRLWLSLPLVAGSTTPTRAPLELRRSMNRGMAGPLYVCSILASQQLLDERTAELAAANAAALAAFDATPDAGMPGLYFGEAGVLVALACARRAKLIATADDEFERRCAAVFAAETSWPDLTHGTAGIGMAALIINELGARPTLLADAARCARRLVHQQQVDGAWEFPLSADGRPERFTGLAHGTAGIALFLCELAHVHPAPDIEASWRLGLQWLMTQALPRLDGTAWRYSEREVGPWLWWCHGNAGIAHALLRIGEITGDETIITWGLAALRDVPQTMPIGNLSECHGLAGLGESYLDAWQVSGDTAWLERAERIARILIAAARTHREAAVWLVEDRTRATADLMVGMSGVLYFLMRLERGGIRRPLSLSG